MEFSALVGMTITDIQGDVSSDELVFTTSEGRKFQMYHSQDCCENVDIEDIVGDLKDLYDSPVLFADENSSDVSPEGKKSEDAYDSHTWTFYRIGTIKGACVIRWHGTSNGYYSESVDFREIT